MLLPSRHLARDPSRIILVVNMLKADAIFSAVNNKFINIRKQSELRRLIIAFTYLKTSECSLTMKLKVLL